MGEVSFTERMSGWVSFEERDYNQAVVAGRRLRTSCSQQLTIEIGDLERFIADGQHRAKLSGFVDCPALGGRLESQRGWFKLFAPYETEGRRAKDRRRMHYRVWLHDGEERPLTLSGFKDVWHGPGLDGWRDTSRLLIRIFPGHLTEAEEPEGDEDTLATGILYITYANFARLFASMLRRGGVAGFGSTVRFDRFFASQIKGLYLRRPTHLNDEDWPRPRTLDPRWQGHEPETWHELVRPAGPRLWRAIVPYKTEDNREGTLHHIKAHEHADTPQGPVMLSHGCSVRANMFYDAPTEKTIVSELVEAGFDVWVENWRGSIDLPASMWTLDEAARFDHPAAIKAISDRTGARKFKALVHCQGSTSFMMAALAGRVSEITDVVSNAVSLHVDLTPVSKLKVQTLPRLAAPFVRGADPQWTARAPTAITRQFAWVASRRKVCNSDVCRSANFFYGVGPNVLWNHENLDDATHEWNDREWGFCPTTFFQQMSKCAQAGHLVPTGEVDGLRESFLDEPKDKENFPRFTFIAGTDNTCFLPSSQVRTFQHFEKMQPGRHRLRLLPGYAHLDVFIGREAHRNVFPHVVEALLK